MEFSIWFEFFHAIVVSHYSLPVDWQWPPVFTPGSGVYGPKPPINFPVSRSYVLKKLPKADNCRIVFSLDNVRSSEKYVRYRRSAFKAWMRWRQKIEIELLKTTVPYDENVGILWKISSVIRSRIGWDSVKKFVLHVHIFLIDMRRFWSLVAICLLIIFFFWD